MEVSYYYKNGKKKKRVKKKKVPKKHPPSLTKLKKETLCNAEITHDTMRLPTIPKSFIGADQPIQERPNGIRQENRMEKIELEINKSKSPKNRSVKQLKSEIPSHLKKEKKNL